MSPSCRTSLPCEPSGHYINLQGEVDNFEANSRGDQESGRGRSQCSNRFDGQLRRQKVLGMAERKKRKQPASSPQGKQLPAESRLAEYATVGWMLMVLTTVGCMLGGLGALFMAGDTSQALALLARLFWLAAMVAGFCSLILLFVLRRVRKVPATGFDCRGRRRDFHGACGSALDWLAANPLTSCVSATLQILTERVVL